MKKALFSMLALVSCMTVPAAGDPGEPGDADALFLEMAAGACNSDDFAALLWPFANSASVRDNFSAHMIVTSDDPARAPIPIDAYLARDDFPIVMIDFRYVTTESFRRFEAAGGDASLLVPVDVQINTAQDERQRVDWAPARFEPGEGDGPGTLIETIGPGGHLLFSPTRDCWQLTADIRESQAAP